VATTRPRRPPGKGTGQSLQLRIAKLEGALIAKDLALADLRRELDPPHDLATILHRVDSLAQRAEKLGVAASFIPGLEVIVRVAQDLWMALPPYEPRDSAKGAARRGDMRDRHAAALDAVLPVDVLLMADRALEEASRVGNAVHHGIRLREMGHTAEEVEEAMARLRREMPLSDADPIALQCVRERLGPSLPQSVTDAQVLEALAIYRLAPKQGRGRPRRGEPVATDVQRAQALAKLLRDDRDGPDVARALRQQRAARIARLEHLGVLRKVSGGSKGRKRP
jgi:hypothetical protein